MRPRPSPLDSRFWLVAIVSVMEMLDHLTGEPWSEPWSEPGPSLPELWSSLDPEVRPGETSQLSLDRLCAHIDADQTERKILILAVVAAVAPERVGQLLGRKYDVAAANLTVCDVFDLLDLQGPCERVEMLRGFRQSKILVRAGLLEVGFGCESDVPVDLMTARVASTYLLVDVCFGLTPVEAVAVPDDPSLEYDA